MAEELPKQELLCKLLKMTASPNDGEALTAIRKANALLSSSGWDWDKLIAAKIVVVGDPFASIKDPTPPKSNGGDHWAPAPPRPPKTSRAAPQRAAPSGPSSGGGAGGSGRFGSGGGGGSYVHGVGSGGGAGGPSPPRTPPRPYSSKPNIYPGGCYCCGKSVDVDQGFVFNPSSINASARPKGLWAPICTDCNKHRAFVPNSKAKRIFPTIHPSVAPDLNSL